MLVRSSGTVEEIPSKAVTTLNAGDCLVIETAGGGYGRLEERDAQGHAQDLRDGKVA